MKPQQHLGSLVREERILSLAGVNVSLSSAGVNTSLSSRHPFGRNVSFPNQV